MCVCAAAAPVLLIAASVWQQPWLSVELSVNPLLECDDDDSNVAVAGAVLRAVQVMSLMLT